MNEQQQHGTPMGAPLDYRHITEIDEEMKNIIQNVQQAIDLGIHPVRISKGSSGSYFCRNTSGEIVGVFKPKNEEPYGQLNPKWTKWLHKTCLPCCFGRSCLMPNLGYISEAAAYFVDSMLGLGVVPQTFVVELASPSFHYSYLDKKKFANSEEPGRLPVKIGSFQRYVKGYIDASHFLRDGPAMLRDGRLPVDSATGGLDQEMQRQFQDQFERLVILDYIIRNTDRGLDNWLVLFNSNSPTTEENESQRIGKTKQAHQTSYSLLDDNEDDLDNQIQQLENSDEGGKASPKEKFRIAAIDNGLAFPFKHPDEWRSYPYGWTFIPAAQVPFTQQTRNTLLPLISSKEWWHQLTAGLRIICSKDDDFDERIFRQQIAVMKGQVYNLVQVLSMDGSNGQQQTTATTNASTSSLPYHLPVASDAIQIPINNISNAKKPSTPIDLVSMPPCLVWEDEDVREFGPELRGGVLGTIIGGLDAIRNLGHNYNPPNSGYRNYPDAGLSPSPHPSAAEHSPTKSLLQITPVTTPSAGIVSESDRMVYPYSQDPENSRRIMQEAIEAGREEFNPRNMGLFLNPESASSSLENSGGITPIGKKRRRRQTGQHGIDAFRGRIITFVKSQPWFRHW